METQTVLLVEVNGFSLGERSEILSAAIPPHVLCFPVRSGLARGRTGSECFVTEPPWQEALGSGDGCVRRHVRAAGFYES